MPPVGFVPMIWAGERPQTYALDRAATGTGKMHKVAFWNLTFLGPNIPLWGIYPTRCNVTQFIISGNCSTCFGWYLHPSSGAHTTVSTASGICYTVTATCRNRIYNKMQRYTVYCIWKLLYMFWVVPPLIIRSAYNCIYSTVRPWLLPAAYSGR